ncbi:hypothetical protein [Sphingomonas sp. Root710]|uniref:hypothetical protein n=1 Tax=Sphingomonas sp. Root710 TaxID=1736594 RepID=UPI000B31B0B4
MSKELSIDSSQLKAPGSAEEYEEVTGRSRGGRACKIHRLADDRCRPVAITLTPGNTPISSSLSRCWAPSFHQAPARGQSL